MCCFRLWLLFCYNQNTAYDLRISDLISDVCSSDRDWPITDKFTVTGGLRYTDDKARFAGSTIDLNPYGVSVAPARFPAIPVLFDNKTSDNNLSGRLTLSYTTIDEKLGRESGRVSACQCV